MSFFKREQAPAPTPEITPVLEAAVPAARTVGFVGLTDAELVEGLVTVDDRLSDILNQREPFAIAEAVQAPLAGDTISELGRDIIDPYEFLVVFAGIGSTPEFTPDEKAAHKIRKMPHEIVLNLDPFQVFGTVHLYAGLTIDALLGRSNELFIPVTNAEVFFGGQRIGAPGLDTVLINQLNLRGVKAYGQFDGLQP